MRFTYLMAALIISVTSAYQSTIADEVLLKDGSRVLGEVKDLIDGKLTVTTGFAGDIQINITEVVGITTDQPVNTQADSGDRAVGPLQYNPQVGQTVVTDPVGRLNLNIDRVTAIWPQGEQSPEEKAQAAEVHRLQNPWSAKISLGYNGQTGNSNTTSINFNASALRDTGDDRLKFYFLSRYSKTNGDEDTREVIGGISSETDINERWYRYGKLDLEVDREEDLKLRANATAGVGYFVTREDDDTFKLHAGVGYQHEAFDDDVSEDQAIIELGYDLTREINSSLLLTHSVTYFPSLERMDDYRITGETAFELPLADIPWSLRLGARNSYDSLPAEDAERLDTYYFLNLVWKWTQADQN